MNIFLKVWTWIKANLATLLDAVQLVIKGFKTAATGLLNAISIIMPASAAEKAILAIRGFLELIDGWIEKMKTSLIPKVA